MNEVEAKAPEAPPAATADPGVAGPTPPGWRDGLRDLGRGMEFGAWIAAGVAIPTAGSLLGVVLGVIVSSSVLYLKIGGLATVTGRWALICAAICAVCAMPVGVAAWLVRGILKRAGRLGPDAATRRRRRRRRWAAVAGLAMLATLAAMGATCYLDRYATRVAKEAIAATYELDPDWRLDDLLETREEVPDDENSALITAKVYELLPKPWPPNPPPEDAPREPGVVDVATALERAVEADSSRRLDEETTEAIRAELEKHREAVALARSLADYDRGRHELEIGPKIIDTLLPETQNARTSPRLLNADAILSAQFGELDAALESCRAIIGAARSIGDEPFLISQLVRMAIDANAEHVVRRVLAQGEPSEEALAALQELLEDEREQPRLWWAVRGERAGLVELISRLMEGELELDDRANVKSAPGPIIDPIMIVGGKYQVAVALRWFNQWLAMLDRPEWEWPAALAAWEVEYREAAESRFARYTTTVPLFLMPAIKSTLEAELRIRAVFGSLIILVAAERQRQATGEWPTSIGEIDRDVLPEPPLDPYSGEPYRMGYADGRLLIYTLGPNLTDEGGAYELKTWKDKVGRDDVGTVGYDPPLRGRPPEAEDGRTTAEDPRDD
ncbi:hypothetical protein [Paludisphaera soli]|uniref:hypothetical protein n=1 Tax=Paludisphaera soli TaxID=2712865 RepID=UPI0013EE1039|nr:hypothetical protein [Paludisphaera soli]